MWNAAVHAEYLHDHSDYGFDVGNVRFSWEEVKLPVCVTIPLVFATIAISFENLSWLFLE